MCGTSVRAPPARFRFRSDFLKKIGKNPEKRTICRRRGNVLKNGPRGPLGSGIRASAAGPLFANGSGKKGKRILWVSLDETNVPVISVNQRGTMKRMPSNLAWRFAAKVRASQTARRLTFTVVAIICSEPKLQALLPQVILVGSKHMSWAVAEEIWPQLPPNVFLRRKAGKGWTNVEEHKTIVDMIGRGLQPLALAFRTRRQITHPSTLALFGDIVPQHQNAQKSIRNQGRRSDHCEPMFFYVEVEKVGHVFEWCNYAAFKDYQVKERWLTALLQSKKCCLQSLQR